MTWWKWCLTRLRSHCAVSFEKVECAKNGMVNGLLDLGKVRLRNVRAELMRCRTRDLSGSSRLSARNTIVHQSLNNLRIKNKTGSLVGRAFFELIIVCVRVSKGQCSSTLWCREMRGISDNVFGEKSIR